MPAHFEIIHPDQSIEFRELTRQGEPYYIGRDAGDEIVISTGALRELYAMVVESDHLLELHVFEQGKVLLNGVPFEGSQTIDRWCEINIEGHVFILLADVEGPAATQVLTKRDDSPDLDPSIIDIPQLKVVAVRFKEMREGSIVYAVQVQTKSQEKAFESTVRMFAEVGRYMKEFIPLEEEQKRCIELGFSPEVFNARATGEDNIELIVSYKQTPLLPAGKYRLRVVARLTRFPEISATNLDEVVDVLPYQQFSVGDPNPASHGALSVLFSSQVASVVTVTNQGNADTRFEIKGENALGSDCSVNFQFQPGSGKTDQPTDHDLPIHTKLENTGGLEIAPLMQAIDIHPGETRSVTVLIQPRNRPIVGLRHPRQQVNLTVLAQGAAPQTKAVRLNTVPVLIGPVRLLLIFIAGLVLTGVHVNSMNTSSVLGIVKDKSNKNNLVISCDGTVLTDTVATVVPDAWVDLEICSAPFTQVILEKIAVNETPEVIDLAGRPQGKHKKDARLVRFLPQSSATYRLTAYHPLSRLLPWSPFVAQSAINIALNDTSAPTGDWGVEPRQVLPGGEVTVYWDKVDQAKKLILYKNDAPHIIPPENIAAGQMKFSVPQPVRFKLEASNDVTTTQLGEGVISVDTIQPVVTPTPLTPPVITRFEVSPAEIVSGQQVLVQWEVAGPAEALTITLLTNGVPAVVPASGVLYQLPQADGDSVRIYQLIADNGQTTANVTKLVNVNVPTPIPMPTPGPIGRPNYDAACGGAGRADLRQLGQFWRWVCLDNPTEDISDKVCRNQYGDKAYAKAEDVGNKEMWMCWR